MDYKHKDHLILEHVESELKDYLLSDQLFWPLNSGERMSLGSLLLARLRSQAAAVQPQDPARLEQIHQRMGEIRTNWRTRWSHKAALEFRSRLRQWELALRELLSADDQGNTIYTHEVTLRVMLSLLQPEILSGDPAGFELLQILDRRLQSASQKTGFIWDSVLEEQFPQDRFWFLYCIPTKKE